MQIQEKKELEFISLMAFLMSIVALAIDTILPAFTPIKNYFINDQPLNLHLMVTFIFLGLGCGQLFFGPLSDSFGRKPMINTGLLLFLFGSIICLMASTYTIMLIGRFIQGIGLSAPRTISITMVRDTYSGNYMARIMSFVTVIFIIIPVLAPILGKILIDYFYWKSIFYSQLIFAFIIFIWFQFRQKETLHNEYQIPVTFNLFFNGIKELLKYPQTIGYTLISGLVSSVFITYLGVSQQIFENQYHQKEAFPYIFAGLAISIGFATFTNGKLVLKLGMFKLVKLAFITFFTTPLLYLICFYNTENPSLPIFLVFMTLQFMALGFVFGNIKAIAMQPIGHIAGIGAAITGFVSTLIAVPTSIYLSSFITTTAYPLMLGFMICGGLALVIILYLNQNKQ